jgi:chromosome segregation ATPase
MSSILSEAVLGVTAAIASLIAQYINYRRHKRREEQTVENTSQKIDRLSNILQEASSEIEKLEEEIRTKSKKVQELDRLSKRLDSLASLREEQAQAIKDELKSTLKESNRMNRVWTILIGALWFILGLIARGFLGF